MLGPVVSLRLQSIETLMSPFTEDSNQMLVERCRLLGSSGNPYSVAVEEGSGRRVCVFLFRTRIRLMSDEAERKGPERQMPMAAAREVREDGDKEMKERENAEHGSPSHGSCIFLIKMEDKGIFTVQVRMETDDWNRLDV